MDYKDIYNKYENYIIHFNLAIQYFKYYDKDIDLVIQKHLDSLLLNVITDILLYCKTNRVKIIEFDDMKISYFLGKELSRLENNSDYMLIAVKLLNNLVAYSTKKNVDSEMIRKISESISAGNWQDEYGEYGIYTIFKTIIRTYTE